MPTKTINGVRYARGCACPICDPGGRLQQRAREDSRAQRRAWGRSLQRVVPLPLATDRPRPVLWAPFETEKTRRLRELLRAGVGINAAIQQIESELKGTP